MTKKWFELVAYDGLGDSETFRATYDIVMSLLRNNVPGEFVECGVYKGAHAAIMARAIMDTWEANARTNWERADTGMWSGPRVHLFDSFAGIPAPGLHDTELLRHGNKGGESAFSLQGVIDKMKLWGIPPELLVYHVGLFERTVAGATEIEQIAFLRLDGDLESSTAVCIDYFYSRVSRGGYICVDDFNLAGCRKAVLERVVPAPIYWVKPTK
jgi:O-methyltransferase